MNKKFDIKLFPKKRYYYFLHHIDQIFVVTQGNNKPNVQPLYFSNHKQSKNNIILNFQYTKFNNEYP